MRSFMGEYCYRRCLCSLHVPLLNVDLAIGHRRLLPMMCLCSLHMYVVTVDLASVHRLVLLVMASDGASTAYARSC